MTESLEAAIAGVREEIAVLRKNGALVGADALARQVDRIANAAEDFTDWLHEPDAQLWSGLRPDTLRRKFPQWKEMGHARISGRGQREYRRTILPRRDRAMEAARTRARARARQALEQG